ncbi:hypothetical protein Mapa_003263 [Marchantia paleacea]|nr:hypothetical protein Mapa_003263 [Marchantia paleacea]
MDRGGGRETMMGSWGDGAIYKPIHENLNAKQDSNAISNHNHHVSWSARTALKIQSWPNRQNYVLKRNR